jgi:hypothetical protein
MPPKTSIGNDSSCIDALTIKNPKPQTEPRRTQKEKKKLGIDRLNRNGSTRKEEIRRGTPNLTCAVLRHDHEGVESLGPA